MSEPFSMSFDPQSLAEIQQFYGFSVLLSDEVQQALNEGGTYLVASIQGSMHWKNGNGDLEASIYAIHDSPYELQVGSNLPYARRRNWGFSGRTDSLGRYYRDDPGAFYMETGMAQEKQHILSLVDAAVERAMNRLGTS